MIECQIKPLRQTMPSPPPLPEPKSEYEDLLTRKTRNVFGASIRGAVFKKVFRQDTHCCIILTHNSTFFGKVTEIKFYVQREPLLDMST
jgi:hypothetical protein